MVTSVLCGLLMCSVADHAFTAKYEAVNVPEAVAEAVRKPLDPNALVVRQGKDVVMRVWFRAAVPVTATDEQLTNGLTYREVGEGELVGVVELPQPFTDFRRQKLPAGAYTLRFAVQPDIGDHAGTSPHPEFCLLTPAEKDATAEPVEKGELVKRSAAVNDGKHPAVLLLYPHFGKDDGPKVVDKGDGVSVVNVRRAVLAGEKKGTLGFGVTVAGQWKP